MYEIYKNTIYYWLYYYDFIILVINYIRKKDQYDIIDFK